jgi:hypothetical protein
MYIQYPPPPPLLLHDLSRVTVHTFSILGNTVYASICIVQMGQSTRIELEGRLTTYVDCGNIGRPYECILHTVHHGQKYRFGGGGWGSKGLLAPTRNHPGHRTWSMMNEERKGNKSCAWRSSEVHIRLFPSQCWDKHAIDREERIIWLLEDNTRTWRKVLYLTGTCRGSAPGPGRGGSAPFLLGLRKLPAPVTVTLRSLALVMNIEMLYICWEKGGFLVHVIVQWVLLLLWTQIYT